MQQFGQITRRLSGWVMLCLALAVSGCSLTDDTPAYRYRLTVEVDTPDGVKTGSSVIEVETSKGKSMMAPAGSVIMHRLRGEAVTVDLGTGRYLFALLRSKSDIDWAKRVMFSLTPSVRSSDGEHYEARYWEMLKRTGEIELPRYFRSRSHLKNPPARPMLVTFGDLDDPTSVEEVDPDDLGATFGEGNSLRRITVQITDDPVTTGIEKRLEWLSEYPEPRLDPEYRGSTNPNLSQSLWHGDFRKGEN
ncbi:hypothetical protein A3718_00965 [Erythrobacter sp. HI0019]|jgi:hypothetical protein|uniref:hypothetical protein n=1 Tax=unclassified Erythrobacter TaxID=2633097 RepID=UPI0007B88A8D|nr:MULTISPECIES: hypothetical protein [unclassified Erythrobacter]KZX94456.1 hypothetical protein A3718_00965 [Erythrobacter sp. HI0019]KZY02401.1 hypothetical protein A3723_00530 [Erythrobacter sp. HI0028]KZY92085.1 hypothetical protein A3745_03860 [Erythrobacter sp. HI0074]KZZ08434.1 hypothetical protein A3748_01780 [Erythrobacter sp. HI0077]